MAIQKPSQQEEEYFARLEFERQRKEAEARRGEEVEEIRRRLAALGVMLCPRCGGELVPVRYRQVEIDKCSRCDGIWLDCGELDRLGEGEGGFLSGMLRIFR
jgi:hypothetical protein